MAPANGNFWSMTRRGDSVLSRLKKENIFIRVVVKNMLQDYSVHRITFLPIQSSLSFLEKVFCLRVPVCICA